MTPDGNPGDVNHSPDEEIEIGGWCKIGFKDNKENEDKYLTYLRQAVSSKFTCNMEVQTTEERETISMIKKSFKTAPMYKNLLL